jgi:predicted RND superfamily exporter protein
MQSILQRFGRLAGRRWGVVFAIFGITVALSAVATSKLHFETDVLNLLPRHDPVVSTFRETLETFGSIDVMLVVVRIPEGANLEGYEAFADRLASKLEAMPHFEYVDGRIGDPEELLAKFLPKSLLFLDRDGLAQIESRLSDEGAHIRAEELRRLITAPQGLALKQLVTLDPLGLGEIFLQRIGRSTGQLSVDVSSGYFLSQDHRLLLLLAKPNRPAQDITFTGQLVGEIEAAIADVTREWPEMAGEEGEPTPEVVLGGGYLTALDDASLIRGDVIVNAVSSTVIVLGLFVFAFRRLSPVFFALLPLASGLALAFGFAAVTLGQLSSATSGVAALLVGLGIDFVIISYARYVEERRAGSSHETAIQRMMGSSGKAVVVGGVTSAATFYAFTFTQFTGLREMGILTGTGILLCMIAVLALLPAMLGWREAHHRKRESSPRHFLHGFGADWLMRRALARPRATVIVGAVITIAAGAAATQLEFEDNIQSMRSPQNRGINVLEEVSRHFGSGFEYMSLVLRGETPEQVISLAQQAVVALDPLVGTESLDGYEAITSMIPAPERQAEALEWRAAQGGPELGATVRARYEQAIAAAGLRPEAFAEGLALLEQTLSVDAPIRAQDFAESAQAERLLERYLRQTEDGRWIGVVKLYPPPVRWKRDAPPALLEVAEALGPQVELTGVNVVSSALRHRVRRDAVIAAVLGFVLVALILWWDYRRLSDVLLSLAPLCVGIVWMLGAMVALGIDMNFMNVFVTTMVIGIGVDYGVHMVHRYRELEGQAPAEVIAGLIETGKAVVMAALSTTVGFGSISLSRYPGLRTIGYVAIIGAIATALISITMLAALLARRIEKARQDRGVA